VKHLAILLLTLLFISCSKYQVVQEVQVNMYHLHNPKKHEIEIIFTKDKLVVGEWYNLKHIKVIEVDKK